MQIAIGNYDALTAGITQEVSYEISNKVEDLVNASVGDTVTDLVDEATSSMTDRIETIEKTLPNKADLGANGKVLMDQIPDTFNDVIEMDSFESFPEVGETGVLYIDGSNGYTYWWSEDDGYQSTNNTSSISDNEILDIF